MPRPDLRDSTASDARLRSRREVACAAIQSECQLQLWSVRCHVAHGDDDSRKCVCRSHPCWDDSGLIHSCPDAAMPYLVFHYDQARRRQSQMFSEKQVSYKYSLCPNRQKRRLQRTSSACSQDLKLKCECATHPFFQSVASLHLLASENSVAKISTERTSPLREVGFPNEGCELKPIATTGHEPVASMDATTEKAQSASRTRAGLLEQALVQRSVLPGREISDPGLQRQHQGALTACLHQVTHSTCRLIRGDRGWRYDEFDSSFSRPGFSLSLALKSFPATVYRRQPNPRKQSRNCKIFDQSLAVRVCLGWKTRALISPLGVPDIFRPGRLQSPSAREPGQHAAQGLLLRSWPKSTFALLSAAVSKFSCNTHELKPLCDM